MKQNNLPDVSIIFAVDKKTSAIGEGNSLPWRNVNLDLNFLKTKIKENEVLVLTENLLHSLPEVFLNFLDEQGKLIIVLNSSYTFSEFTQSEVFLKSKKILILGGFKLFDVALSSGLVDKVYVNYLNFEKDIKITKETKFYDFVGKHRNFYISKVDILGFDNNTSRGKCFIISYEYRTQS